MSNAALVNVRLPDANAEVWVEGQQTRQRGTWREYISPPLNPDRDYVYDIRARWTENGKEVERTRTVPVQANGVATVDFTAPETKRRVDELDRGRTSPRPGGEARPGEPPAPPPPGEARPKGVPPRDVKPGSTGRPSDVKPGDHRPGDTDRPPPDK